MQRERNDGAAPQTTRTTASERSQHRSSRGLSRVTVSAAATVAIAMSAACGSAAKPATTHSPTTTSARPATSAPATTTTTGVVTDLSITGVGPGVNEAPFYPTVTVNSVACGNAPNGRFVEVLVPAGLPGTPPRSALAEATGVLVVPGRAVLKDRTGKTLYEEDMSSITTGRQGGLVLSMTNTTSYSGDNRVVETGAVNVEGDFACPTKDVGYPGG